MKFLMALLVSVYTLHIATSVSRHIRIAMLSTPLVFAPMVSYYVAIVVAYVKTIGSVYTRAFCETTLIITGLSIVLLIATLYTILVEASLLTPLCGLLAVSIKLA